MAFAYHRDRTRYFQDQCQVTEDYLVPFVEADRPLPTTPRVLEIGCAEAGVLLAFLKRGGTAVGVDRNERRLNKGRELHAEAIKEGKLELINIDAAELANMPGYFGTFDLIVLKDVIEHIDDKPRLFGIMARLLRPDGRVFLSFPLVDAVWWPSTNLRQRVGQGAVPSLVAAQSVRTGIARIW